MGVVARRRIRVALLFVVQAAVGSAQSDSILTGRVTDAQSRPIAGAQIVLRNLATLDERSAVTNYEGIYFIPALPVGAYRMRVQASGFRLYTVEGLTTQVARTLTHDVRLELGDLSQEVTVTSEREPIDRVSIAVGEVIDGRTVQEAPLNGRYFLDLAVLATGSVTAPQSGFSTTPSRGLGALAVNTAGNREETINYLVNGITLTNLTFSAIEYQPSISSVQ